MKNLILSLVISGFLTPSLYAFDLDGSFENAKFYGNYGEKIAYYSSLFLGFNYEGGPLGEGEQGLYDQDPLLSFKKFDCTTYIETIISLSLSGSKDDFLSTMNEIRYKDGVVSFITRNHFTSLDWILNNSRILKDITDEVSGDRTAYAKTLIDKKSWYKHKKDSDLKLGADVSQEERKNILEALKNEGNQFGTYKTNTPYVPLSVFFKNGNPNLEMLNKIPNGAIISIVRPGWDLRETIGTRINISHQGFAIWEKDHLLIRHASTQGSVREESFVEYFKKYIESETVKGFNILELY